MWYGIKVSPGSAKERGSVLLVVAFGMVLMLALAAFAIDLANFYLARAQAQRAADAAALGGAYAFLQTGCITGGCYAGGPQETLGRQYAEASGNQNYIAGQLATIQDSDITFSYPNAWEPQITVLASRNVPTFFAKIFGIQTAYVNAVATAEAYTPAGSGSIGNPGIAASCIKPFLVPNCDPNHTTGTKNPICDEPYFIDPSTHEAVNPGLYTEGGIQGMPWTLHTLYGPSQWHLVGFGDAPPSSGSALRDHIAECMPASFACTGTLVSANGFNVGPIDQGVNALIHASADGMGHGQDSIDPYHPNQFNIFPITAGINNPNPQLSVSGATFYDYTGSPSVAVIPVYSGADLPPGGTTVGIDGYLHVFIQDAEHNGYDDIINMVVLNAVPCKGGTSSSDVPGDNIDTPAGSPVPIRLIRTN